MKLYRKVVYLFVLLCFTTALAQATTCSAMVQQALADVQQGCAPTGRNQACYGYVSLDATPRDGVQNFTFAKAGDLVNVADIDTLRLSALDAAKNTWGIALMKLQANLPDALPGQNVTFLLFGDVQITNAVTPSAQQATVQLTAKNSANLRSTPSTSGQVIGSVGKNDSLIANGRSSDSTWLRIQIPNSQAQGWVFATLVTPASDVSALSVVDATQTNYTPMQAFYFKTGITQTSCSQAPQDGILIQTPQGQGQINLRANDVDVHLGSTAFLQAQPSANMTVSVVEGEGHVTSGGKTVAVPAGSQVTIPVDANLKATGAPSDAKPYDPALVAFLPIQDLPEQITIAAPIATEQAAPPAASSSGNLSIPGFGNLPSMTMNEAQFCAVIGQEISATGLSKSQYLSIVQQAAVALDAKGQAEMTLFAQKLNACP